MRDIRNLFFDWGEAGQTDIKCNVTSFLPHFFIFSLDQNYLVETEDDSRTGKVILQFQ